MNGASGGTLLAYCGWVGDCARLPADWYWKGSAVWCLYSATGKGMSLGGCGSGAEVPGEEELERAV